MAPIKRINIYKLYGHIYCFKSHRFRSFYPRHKCAINGIALDSNGSIGLKSITSTNYNNKWPNGRVRGGWSRSLPTCGSNINRLLNNCNDFDNLIRIIQIKICSIISNNKYVFIIILYSKYKYIYLLWLLQYIYINTIY